MDYVWLLSGEDMFMDKIFYVKVFKFWGWIIGLGIYLMYLEEEYVYLRNIIIIFCVISVVLVILLIYIIGGSIVKFV